MFFSPDRQRTTESQTREQGQIREPLRSCDCKSRKHWYVYRGNPNDGAVRSGNIVRQHPEAVIEPQLLGVAVFSMMTPPVTRFCHGSSLWIERRPAEANWIRKNNWSFFVSGYALK